MYAEMVSFRALLDTCLHGFRLFRAESQLTPVAQETVCLVISPINAGMHCVAAHRAIANAVSKAPAESRSGDQLVMGIDTDIAARHAMGFAV